MIKWTARPADQRHLQFKAWYAKKYAKYANYVQNMPNMQLKCLFSTWNRLRAGAAHLLRIGAGGRKTICALHWVCKKGHLNRISMVMEEEESVYLSSWGLLARQWRIINYISESANVWLTVRFLMLICTLTCSTYVYIVHFPNWSSERIRSNDAKWSSN